VIAMSSKTKANEEYKDRLFKFLFGNPENKEWTLSLYNAINNTSYDNPNDIELTTIEDAVYMSMKNDVSFLFKDVMNLYEQQSTFNPNMPMRFLIYAGMIYNQYTESNDYHKFSYKQQKAPTPRCICFYNGIPNKDDKMILKLSDSFEPGSKPDIEVTVTMININYGHNRELMEVCRPLKEYSWFVDRVRNNQKQYEKKDNESLKKSISDAINELDDDSLIKPFLLKNKAEVENMCITEYNEEKTLSQLEADVREDALAEGIEIGRKDGIEIGRKDGIEIGRKDGIEIGRKDGIEKGKLETAINLLSLGVISKENIAKATGFTIEKIKEIAAQNNFATA